MAEPITTSAVIGGIIAFVKAIPIIDGWIQEFIVSYLNGVTAETKQQIADAAAMGARAKTDEERYKAAAAWRDALSRSRVSR